VGVCLHEEGAPTEGIKGNEKGIDMNTLNHKIGTRRNVRKP
jgi:hypothetical protein